MCDQDSNWSRHVASHYFRGWSHFMLNLGCRTVTPNITVVGSPTPAPAPASSSAPASVPATVPPPPPSTVPVTAAPSPSYTTPGPTQSVSSTEIGFEPNYLFFMSTVVTIITYFCTWQILHQFLQKGLTSLAVHCGREETLHRGGGLERPVEMEPSEAATSPQFMLASLGSWRFYLSI